MIFGKRDSDRDRIRAVFCWLPKRIRDGRWVWLDFASYNPVSKEYDSTT